MFNSDDEFVMDFKAEEKSTQLPTFDTEDIWSDCTTISASEDDGDGRNNATPPLFWELKKVRVLMKKLPRHVLKKYKINSKKIKMSTPHPSRRSGRLTNNQIPLKYLALHVNKPLDVVRMQNKRNIELQQMKVAEKETTEKQRNLNKKKCTPFEHKQKRADIADVISSNKINVNTGKNSRGNILATRLKEKRLITDVTNPPNINLISSTPLRIADRPVTSTLPNCPDVMITKYSIPSTSLPNSTNRFILNASAPTALGSNYIQNPITVSQPQHYIPANYSPALTTPPGSRVQIPRQPIVFNTATTRRSVVIRPPSNSAPRTFTIQAFKVPHELSASTTTDSPKVLIIKQPSLATDPLDMSSVKSNNINLTKKIVPETMQNRKNNYSNDNVVVCNESESDSELSDSEKQKEPEVIKRIIYNNKSVQTKFTCNGSICGLVDSDEFNFNCFYCYDIFPLHKWFEFKEHIKLVHHVEEKENQSDLNEDVSNYSIHKNDQTISRENINVKKITNPLPKLIRNNDDTITKGFTNTEKSFKKLPLEPGLITQHANIPCKINSVQTIPYPSRSQSEVSVQSSLRKLSNEVDIIYPDKADMGDVTKTALRGVCRSANIPRTDPIKISSVQTIPYPSRSQSEVSVQSSSRKLSNEVDIIYPDKVINLNSDNCKVDMGDVTKTALRGVCRSANILRTDPIKISSVQTIPYPSKNQSEVSLQSTGRKLSNKMDIIYPDKVINLNSDNCKVDMVDVTKTALRSLQFDQNTANKQSYIKKRISRLGDVKLVLPSLPHITIKKVNQPLSGESFNTSNASTSPLLSKKTIINVVSTPNIKQIMKTVPKPGEQELSPNDCKKRYFVVKKIIKVPPGQEVPNINGTQGSTLTKMQQFEKSNSSKKEYDDMPANDENEVSAPKPTEDYGILFGVTNSVVVIEFLVKLKSFPELWQPELINTSSFDYNESIKKLCFHLNSRFNLNLTEIAIRRSVQRAQDWYRRIVKNINEHNENPNNTEPYKHKFQLYFKILESFLTAGVQDTNADLNTAQFNSNANAKTNEIVCKTATLPPVEDSKSSQATTFSPNTPLFVPKNIDHSQNTDKSASSLIEFDADTLYDNEEVLDKSLNNQIVDSGPKKKRTKVYVGVYECEFCRKVFKRRCDLKRHTTLHYPPQFECGKCSQKFYFKHSLEKCAHVVRNITTVMGKKIYPKKIFEFKLICEFCGVSYRSIGSLNTHKRDKHLNQREKCVVCNFTALSNWRIVQHQKKRHIVEPGTVEEIAKKSRARTETKTRFSNEARQEFDWRREMRKKLKPGEIFYGCCKCRITFNTRKEKYLHNKAEHPITEFTVICLLCLPQNKLLLSNSNGARRHYTDIHKVAWHEIDGLVKRTKPIFDLLNKEEIELLKASANYKELLEELLKDKKLEPAQNVQMLEDETITAVQNLPSSLTESDDEGAQIDVAYSQEETVYVDGIIDHDYNCEESYSDHENASKNEHNYSEEKEIIQNYDDHKGKNELYSQNSCDDGIVHLGYDIESNNNKLYNYVHNDHEYVESIVEDFVEEEQVDESLVVEEYIDEVIDQEDDFF